jgi:uncharacterized membrane protein
MYIVDAVGWLHLIASILALVFGSWVLITPKGTRAHRRVGYLYAISMILLIVTAFQIYRLFGRFGVFHVAAVASVVTLACGMIPAVLRKPKSWLNLHFSFMYWSVFGLYAAFFAEVAVRLPIRTMFTSARTFFTAVIVSTLVTMCVGQIIFFTYKKRWQEIPVASAADGNRKVAEL